jgi:hypothetical protein
MMLLPQKTAGAFRVALPNRPPVVRPNRLAAGMSYTAARAALYRGRRPRDAVSDDALRLVVHGTTDGTRRLAYSVERVACPCCGSKQAGKLRLNENGRVRLIAARRRGMPGFNRPPGGFAAWARLFPE